MTEKQEEKIQENGWRKWRGETKRKKEEESEDENMEEKKNEENKASGE